MHTIAEYVAERKQLWKKKGRVPLFSVQKRPAKA